MPVLIRKSHLHSTGSVPHRTEIVRKKPARTPQLIRFHAQRKLLGIQIHQRQPTDLLRRSELPNASTCRVYQSQWDIGAVAARQRPGMKLRRVLTCELRPLQPVHRNSRNSCMRSATSSPRFSSHSQMTRIFQPISSSFARFFWSRRALPFSLGCQKSRLELGSVALRQPGSSCWCQKQPCTNITFRRPANTMSGVPGRSFLCNR